MLTGGDQRLRRQCNLKHSWEAGKWLQLVVCVHRSDHTEHSCRQRSPTNLQGKPNLSGVNLLGCQPGCQPVQNSNKCARNREDLTGGFGESLTVGTTSQIELNARVLRGLQVPGGGPQQ
jgi:hypothetical protein